MKTRFGMCLLLLFIVSGQTSAQLNHSFANETKAQRDQRMRWWREARFGMFIHWGLYAVPAGEYNGKRSDRIGEWIMDWAIFHEPSTKSSLLISIPSTSMLNTG